MEIKKAVKDIIVIKQLVKKKVSQGGIALPDNVSQQPNSDKIGEVVMVGADVVSVQTGDIIAFSHNYANVVNFGDKIRIFIKEENLLAILETN